MNITMYELHPAISSSPLCSSILFHILGGSTSKPILLVSYIGGLYDLTSIQEDTMLVVQAEATHAPKEEHTMVFWDASVVVTSIDEPP